MMLLEVGAEFTCTVSADHYFLQQANSTSLIKKCLEACPIRPLVLDRKVYFAFDLTVSSNPTLENFKFGTLGSREEIIQKCMKREGAGLNCVLPAIGKPMLIKFHHFINHPLSIMFWNVHDSLNPSSVLRQKLKDCKDIETVQKYYHKMNFNTGKSNGWLIHLSHVM